MTSKNMNLTLAAAVAMALAGPAVAAEVDTSGWKCESCPFQTEYEASADLGGTYVSDDSARFGRYNGYNEKGGYGVIDAAGKSRSEDGKYVSYELRDLALDTRFARITAGLESGLAATLFYDEIPANIFDTTTTSYLGAGSGVLKLPSGWVKSGTTAGMTALNSTQQPVDIGWERQTLGAAVKYKSESKLDLYARYARQEKSGTGIIGGSFLTQAAQLAKPIDDVTSNYELGAIYRMKSGFLRVSYSGSLYSNAADSLTWDNAYSGFSQTSSTGRMTLAPDNSAQTVALDGNWRLPLNSVFSFRAALGEIRQDDILLAASTLSPPGGSVPKSSLEGRIDTTAYGLGFTSRPMDKLRIRMGYRRDERDDKTDPLAVTYVTTDTGTGTSTKTTRRYDFTRENFDASGDFDLFRWLSLGGGYERINRDYTSQSIESSVTDRNFLRLALRPFSGIELLATFGEEHRDAAENGTLYVPKPGDNPLMRKYNLANRDRDFGSLMLSWSPTEKLSIGIDGGLAYDDYRRSKAGLQEANDLHYAGTISYAFTENATAYVTGGHQKVDSTQVGGSEAVLANLWTARYDDKFENAGAGFKVDEIAGKFDFGMDYSYGKSTGDIINYAAASTPFPTLKSKLESASVTAGMRLGERGRIGLLYRYEKLDSSDWQLDGVQPGTVPTLISLGADAYNYNVDLISLVFSYKFGNLGPALKKE
jgi:MtrB/PioB family decaheme-associated outer membrane protein